MIFCQNIVKSYGTQAVLDGISCVFENTGFYLLLGESGSGKTTFLNILAGLLPFEEGCVIWNGKPFENIVDRSDVGEGIAYITQDAYFVDFLTVADNMRLVVEDDKAISRVLERFGLSDKAEQYPQTLSGGEKQRLAIARVMLGKKSILLLDEPTAALDFENKQTVFELLADIGKECLVICSSHDEMAREYAHHVINFTKSTKKANSEYKREKKPSKVLIRDVRFGKKRPSKYLKKWFSSSKRHKKTSLLFLIVLIFSVCLCIFADIPQNKLESSAEYMYNINMMSVDTADKTAWGDVVPGGEGILEVMINYQQSCPLGNGDLDPEQVMRPTPNYELMINALPSDARAFKLSDKILYGSYFTKKDQIILSYEMASFVSPGDPSLLVGQHVQKKLYGLGVVDLEIVGIFGAFDKTEKTYLRAIGINIAEGERYEAANYTDLCFVNSALFSELEGDGNFYSDSGRRSYYIFFDSFKDMKAYYDRYSADLRENYNVTLNYSTASYEDRNLIQSMFFVFLPLAIFMAFFTVIFYSALKKTEIEHNNRFVAVFELSGYSKTAVLASFIRLCFFELVKLLAIANGEAFLITVFLNVLNNRLRWIGFVLFSYNLPMILAFDAFVLITAVLALCAMLSKVKADPWYKTLISSRDLI